MSTKTKYVARYNGKIIGQRKSPRPYAFAIIAQTDEAHARAFAYDYKATKEDRKSYDYHVEVAACTPKTPIHHPAGFDYFHTAAEIADSKEKVAGGFEGFVADIRANLIERFETAKAKGGFEPHVHGWSMSKPNAEKMGRAAAQDYAYAKRHFLAIVPVEVA